MTRSPIYNFALTTTLTCIFIAFAFTQDGHANTRYYTGTPGAPSVEINLDTIDNIGHSTVNQRLPSTNTKITLTPIPKAAPIRSFENTPKQETIIIQSPKENRPNIILKKPNTSNFPEPIQLSPPTQKAEPYAPAAAPHTNNIPLTPVITTQPRASAKAVPATPYKAKVEPVTPDKIIEKVNNSIISQTQNTAPSLQSTKATNKTDPQTRSIFKTIEASINTLAGPAPKNNKNYALPPVIAEKPTNTQKQALSLPPTGNSTRVKTYAKMNDPAPSKAAPVIWETQRSPEQSKTPVIETVQQNSSRPLTPIAQVDKGDADLPLHVTKTLDHPEAIQVESVSQNDTNTDALLPIKTKTQDASRFDVARLIPQEPKASVPDIKQEVAALAPLPNLDDLTLRFNGSESDLDPNRKQSLDTIVEHMNTNDSLRLQLRSYAASADGSQSSARRISLARAIEIRKYIMDKGIRPTRIDVRALGDKTDQTPIDRIDMVFVQ